MKLFFISLFLISTTTLFSQSYSFESLVSAYNKIGIIKGVIFDNEVNPEGLAFTNISVKNSNITTTTDINGSYSIQLSPGNYTLIFSFLGYKTMEIKNIKVVSNKTIVHNQILNPLQIYSDISSIGFSNN